MVAEISDRVRKVAEARGLSEGKLFERGVKGLWDNPVPARYLGRDLERGEVIERAGRTKSNERSESVQSSRRTWTGA
jgi:hypothetical protein